MKKQIIYGDIGGTKTILQLAEVKDGTVYHQSKQRYENRIFESFSALLQDFLNQSEVTHPLMGACFAVAGPIVKQQVILTNLVWEISSSKIARDFAIPSVKIINDFEAAALGVEDLPPTDLITLQEGQTHVNAMRVILGAGTGMGVAWLTCLDGRYYALSTEAGHIDFAPANKLQISLLETLQDKFGHVSVERLLSGSGLTNIFNFLQIHQVAPSSFAAIHLEEDSGAMVTNLAEVDQHPIAIGSLSLFCEIYGAFAGNLALAGLCRGGVYIAGGIAPKIINTLKSGVFMRAFRDKGRFSMLMNEIPVHVITNPEISLLGARREVLNLIAANN